MNEPLTLVGLGALVPLVLAFAAWGAASAKLNRVQLDVVTLTKKVDQALLRLERHDTKIEHLENDGVRRERELLHALETVHGVGNTRGAPSADDPI